MANARSFILILVALLSVACGENFVTEDNGLGGSFGVDEGGEGGEATGGSATGGASTGGSVGSTGGSAPVSCDEIPARLQLPTKIVVSIPKSATGVCNNAGGYCLICSDTADGSCSWSVSISWGVMESTNEERTSWSASATGTLVPLNAMVVEEGSLRNPIEPPGFIINPDKPMTFQILPAEGSSYPVAGIVDRLAVYSPNGSFWTQDGQNLFQYAGYTAPLEQAIASELAAAQIPCE